MCLSYFKIRWSRRSDSRRRRRCALRLALASHSIFRFLRQSVAHNETGTSTLRIINRDHLFYSVSSFQTLPRSTYAIFFLSNSRNLPLYARLVGINDKETQIKAFKTKHVHEQEGYRVCFFFFFFFRGIPQKLK